MKTLYTVIIRKSQLQYVAVCLELNLSACGETLSEVETNLKNAIDLYLQDVRENPDTVISSMSIEELIEFFKDTRPDCYFQNEKLMLNPFEVHEVRAYA
ncbi:MAG: hypothetical protein HQK77_21740 [Desulfobacterales bacterium]|nr:hypothetical protein [Desulfobacterales bacterium]